MRRDRNFEGNEPLLYLIATPIGNLQEVSPRTIAVSAPAPSGTAAAASRSAAANAPPLFIIFMFPISYLCFFCAGRSTVPLRYRAPQRTQGRCGSFVIMIPHILQNVNTDRGDIANFR